MCSTNYSLDGIAGLKAGLAALAESQPAELDGIGLAEQLVELQRISSALAAQVTRRIAVFHTRGDAQAEGYLSTKAFLTHRLRLTPGEARQQVLMGATLPGLPATAAAFDAGAISAKHAAAICHGAEKVGVEVIAAAEDILLEAAAGLDAARLSRVVTHIRHVVDPDGADADAAEAFDRRGLWASPTLDGMVRVDGLLDPDTGEALLAAVNSGPPPTAEDTRTPAQRRADRLGEILRAYLASGDAPTSGGQPTQVTLTAGIETMQGRGGAGAPALDWIGPIDSATARLLGCDCQVTGILLDSDGSPLNVGWRHRTATPSQRLALAVRDKHCQAPGCDRPAQWCDAHHVIGWYHGGRTDLNNLILLCRRHHRAVHQRSWRIQALGDGRFRFIHTGRQPPDHHQRQPRTG